MYRRTGKSGFFTLIVFAGDILIINTWLLVFYALTIKEGFNFRDDLYHHCFLALNFGYLPVYMMIKEQHKQRIFESDRLLRLAFYATLFHFIAFYFLMDFMQNGPIEMKFSIPYFSVLFFALSGWWFLGRELLKAYRVRGFNFRTVIILGAGPSSFELAQKISKDPTFGFRLLGYFDDHHKEDAGGVPLLGKIDDVIDFCENNHIDEIFCALPISDGDRILKILNYSERNLIRFFIIPAYYTYLKRRVELQTLSGIPFLSLFREPLEEDFNRYIKRAFDIVFSSIVLLTVFPIVYVATALAIRISSPGPIFFKQKRTGLQGDDFVCYKFRTMKVNVNSDKMQATKDDPRKTKVGNFLRKTNIDEIPQFINVLRGEMSVVGPRPHMLKHTEDYSALIDKYMVRHLVKPGVTGWAQVNGFRGETKDLEQMEGRVKCDMWYIENWTLWLDIKIVIKTITNMFRGEQNAY